MYENAIKYRTKVYAPWEKPDFSNPAFKIFTPHRSQTPSIIPSSSNGLVLVCLDTPPSTRSKVDRSSQFTWNINDCVIFLIIHFYYSLAPPGEYYWACFSSPRSQDMNLFFSSRRSAACGFGKRAYLSHFWRHKISYLLTLRSCFFFFFYRTLRSCFSSFFFLSDFKVL